MTRKLSRVRKYLDNQHERDVFVREQLALVPPGNLILDAGAGSQRYRDACSHLEYRAQDLGEYKRDRKQQLGDKTSQTRSPYPYGPLDYIGDIWDVDEEDGTFDAILCTEVLEHVPYPIETLRELSRLLKRQGTLILTAPSNCLRHFDPFFFTSGLSDRWYEYFCHEFGLDINLLTPVGDYYRWMAVELYRTAKIHKWATPLLAPAFAFYSARRPTPSSQDTLPMGYHLVARKSATMR